MRIYARHLVKRHHSGHSSAQGGITPTKGKSVGGKGGHHDAEIYAERTSSPICQLAAWMRGGGVGGRRGRRHVCTSI